MDEVEILETAIKEVREELREIRAKLDSLQQFRWTFVGGLGVIAALIIPILLDIFGP